MEIYFNKDFTDAIYEPLIRNMDELYDDTDLFMRALHLAKLADKHMPHTVAAGTAKPAAPAAAASAKPRKSISVFSAS